MMYCKFCGAEIKDDSAFCSVCGKTQKKIEKVKTKKKSLKVVCMVALAVFVIGISFLFAYKCMTEVEILCDTVEAGSIIKTNDLVKAKSSSASISIDGEINTDKLGEYVVECNVSNGIFKGKKTLTVTVSDTKAPVIEGPDTISMMSGKDFVPDDYYGVSDFEDHLAADISVMPGVDSDKEGEQKVTLTVSDSFGNVGTLDITVNVLKLTTEEEKAMMAINQYIADGNSASDILPNVWVMKTSRTSESSNDVDYYVQVAKNVLYAIHDDGKVNAFTALDCGGDEVYELMVFATQYNGKFVGSAKLINK